MQHAVHYLETGSRDPYYNLAFEEYVLTHRTRGDYLLLWQNDNTIVVGQNQNTEAEINRPFVEAHHIHVVRRSTGGGAVYHDLGNLNYSFITDAGDRAALSMARFTQPVVEALHRYGLTERHARALLRLADGEQRLAAAEHIGKAQLNVSAAEAYIEHLLSQGQVTPPRQRRTFIIKDVRLFLNSVERGIRLMRGAGVGARVARQDTEDEICLTVRIPKGKAG